MQRTPRGATLAGLGIGTFIAIGFALVISVLPEELFVETGRRAVLYAVQVPAGPVFVIVLRWIAGRLRVDSSELLLWAVAAALAFDGLVIGFWPGLYGQTGDALTYTATTMLWAFAWILIAGLAMEGRAGAAARRTGARAPDA